MHRRNGVDEWSDEAQSARPSIAMADPMRDIENGRGEMSPMRYGCWTIRCIIKQKVWEMAQREPQMPYTSTTPRAHSCAEVATGAGAADSDEWKGSSRSSAGNNISFCASELSRTGLVAELAGEVDSN
jgi:hypothetical protein